MARESRERSRYAPEFKDEAVRLVIESGRPIAQVARELRINDGTLGNWVARYRDEHPVSESPLSVSERARLAELERENRQLRLDNEFLGKRPPSSRKTVGERALLVHPGGEGVLGVPGQAGLRAEVSPSGFYAWRDRPASATSARRAEVAVPAAKAHAASDGTNGYRRVHRDLLADGVVCSWQLVRRVLREQDLAGAQPRAYRVTTLQDAGAQAAPDLICRDFTSQEPGTKLVGDITYIRTWAGWAYLAVVIDLSTKMVVGSADRQPGERTAVRRGARDGAPQRSRPGRRDLPLRSRLSIQQRDVQPLHRRPWGASVDGPYRCLLG